MLLGVCRVDPREMGNRVQAIRAHLHIVYLRDNWGFGEETFPVVRQVVVDSRPDWWAFLNPNAFEVFFIATHADSAAALVRSAAVLRSTVEPLATMQIGSGEGEMTCEIDSTGRIVSSPMGEAVNRVMMNAR